MPQTIKSVMLLVLLYLSSFANAESPIDGFVDTFSEAIKGKQMEKLERMNYWVGVPEEQKLSIIKSFKDIAEKGIIKIRVEEILDEASVSFERKGREFSPNLPPLAKLYIEVNTGKSFLGGYSFYIGKKDNELKLSHIILKNL